VVDGAYTVTTQFVLAGGQEIADYNGTGVGTAWVLTVRGAGGLPVASITPSASGSATVAAYYHHDVMGSTVAATEPGYSGAAMVFNYSDFGVPGAGSGLSYTYAGYRYDAETGLYYVNARYYNPNLGRFLQTDPIGLQGGTNLYAYVGNDPINLIDPSGHCAQWASQSPDMSIFGNSTPNVVLGPQLSYTVIGDKAPNGSGGYQPAQDVAFNVTTSVAGLIVQQVTFSGSGPSVPPTYYETFSVSAQGVVTPANAGGYQDTQGLVPPATNDILAAQYSGQTITATAAFYPGLQLSNPAMAGFAQGNVPQAGILPSSYTAPNLPNPNSPTTATSLPVTRVFTSP
jgi:RHS repeat-associated protein